MEKAALNIIALFLIDEVILGTGVREVSLLSERSVELILPKVTPLGSTEEWIDVLSARCGADSEFRVLHRAHHTSISCGSVGLHIGVVTWSRLVVLDLSIFAVGHLREEDALLALRVELLCLLRISLVVCARTWVLSWWIEFVLDVDAGLEDLSSLLGCDEVADGGPSLVGMLVGVVQSWTNSVMPTTCVHI